MNFDNQIKAINTAIRELSRARVKAEQTENREWMDELDITISELRDAIETIKAIRTLRMVLR